MTKSGRIIEPPLFTLRGHKTGVTCLAHLSLGHTPHLVSGDENGELCLWNLVSYRKVKQAQVATSRLQCVKTVQLVVDSQLMDVLIVQSRDHGIHILEPQTNFTESFRTLAKLSTKESLFSRGDALSISDGRALLAYPSALDSHLVTLRIIGDDAKTLESGTAKRHGDNEKTCSVFDIRLLEMTDSIYHVYIAFEDGHICVFSTDLTSRSTIPALNTIGLRVELIKDCDLGISDFVSAFDIISDSQRSQSSLICGSPQSSLIHLKIRFLDAGDIETELGSIKIKRPGTSVISIRPDNQVVVAAGWDSAIRVFSTDDFNLLSESRIHAKQVQSIMFIDQSDHKVCDDTENDYHDNVCKKYLMCCASLEGTISVTAFID